MLGFLSGLFFCCKFLWMNAPGHARPEEFQRLRRFTGGRWHHWHTKRCPNSVKTMVCGGNTILRFRFQLYFIRSHCLLRVVGMNKTEVVNCNSSFWFGFSPGLTFMYHDVSTFSIICWPHIRVFLHRQSRMCTTWWNKSRPVGVDSHKGRRYPSTGRTKQPKRNGSEPWSAAATMLQS